MPYARLLVPVDFSDHATTAAKLAAALARRFAASMTLLHVDHLPPVADRLAQRMRSDVWEAYIGDRNDTLRHMLVRERDAVGADADVDTALARDGTPAAIVRYARERAFDLIVMGSHGGDLTGRFLLGSVASPVAAVAHCPVVATRTQHADRLPVTGQFRRPLIAVDFCADSDAAARMVRDLAGPDATIDLVHAWAPRTSWLLGPKPIPDELSRALEREQGELEARLARMADTAGAAGLKTRAIVDKGRAVDVLLRLLDHGDHDVVLVGARRRAGDRTTGLGSVAERVLHCSPAPVVVIPASGA